MTSRWEALPLSERASTSVASLAASQALKSAGDNTTIDFHSADARESTLANILLHIGELLNQTSSENDEVICLYRNLTNNEVPISLICQLGCCPSGCCDMDEFTMKATFDHGWALLLLVAFIICVLLASCVMCVLYVYNQQKDRRIKTSRDAYSPPISGGSSRSTYAPSLYSSELSPRVYHSGIDPHSLPPFYPTFRTFKSAL